MKNNIYPFHKAQDDYLFTGNPRLKINALNRIKKIIPLILVIIFIDSTSCNKLEEYNPNSVTSENTFNSPEEYETLINQCYSNLRAMCYGREDMLFLAETGTDIWHPTYDKNYAQQINKYLDLSSAVGLLKNVWDRFYVPINLCNAAIGRVDNAGYTDEAKKNAKVAEAHFLRAFIYWHIVEWWGNVSLTTTETSTPVFKVYRSPISEFYKVIFDDLDFAIKNLPVNHATGENGRATKKAAHGLLARIYLTYASYLNYFENNKTEADKYYTLARNTAKEVIDARSTYGIQLYDNFEQLFDPANNKINKEALYVVSHSYNAALEVNSGNPNRLFQWYQARYSNQPGMVMSLEYSRDGSAHMQPTKYLLELFDETKDARYAATFQEVWLCNDATKNVWDASSALRFGKDASIFKAPMKVADGGVGDTALLYTKKHVPNKATIQYAVFDMDDMYTLDGILAHVSNLKPFFPSLRKFRDPDRASATSQAGGKDVILIRLAEMYLIAAEAEFHLGHEPEALTFVNVIRTRAAIKTPFDKTAEMQATSAEVAACAVGSIPGYLNFILDERARELCGEHLRWFDLKRTKQLENRLGPNAPIKGNPNITLFDATKHYIRPIPLNFLQNIDNAEEFGQNPGYN